MEELQLELTTVCNSNCIMCPRSKLKRGIGTMSENFAIRVIDDAYNLGARMIKLQWFGETLLVPYWNRIAKYAHHKRMKVILFTNGSLLNSKNSKAVLSYVDKVFISIDSSDRKTYEQIRRGLKYDQLISNLRSLIDERHTKLPKTKIILSQVKVGINNDDNLDNLKDLCDRIVSNYDNINVEVKKKVDVVCTHKVNNRLVVGWNGKCYLCCHDWLGDYEIGDLKNQSMKSIWNGEKRLNLIRNLNSLKICQKCMQ